MTWFFFIQAVGPIACGVGAWLLCDLPDHALHRWRKDDL